MGVHREKLESVMQRAIQDILGRGLHDPRIKGMVSVTRVSLSKDLADATVYISVAPSEHETITMHGLRAAAPHIRSAIGKKASLRRLPRLAFKVDAAHKREAKVLAELTRIQQEDEPLKGNSET